MVQAQLVREPFPFCRACHAPEANPNEPAPEGVSRLGVGCVTCHVVDDRILAGSSRGSSPRPSPHPVFRKSAFDGASGCGGCHEFPFPDSASGPHRLLMQSTMSEHASSPSADRSCASCHMTLVDGPREGRHRDHRFAASRDVEQLRSAVKIEETSFDERGLVLTLRRGAVGHAFPTGDMLRRLAIEVDAFDATDKRVGHEERFLARHFGFVRAPFVAPRKVVVRDDRVGVGDEPTVFRYVPPDLLEGGRIHYTVRYERVSAPTGGKDGGAVVDDAAVLAEGERRVTPRPR